MWDFKVGMEVICIDDSPTTQDGKCDLVMGHVYTLRWVGMWQHPTEKSEILCVRLNEIVRDGPFGGYTRDEVVPIIGEELYEYCLDMPFRADRFRPLEKKSTETGMAILRGILAGEKILESS